MMRRPLRALGVACSASAAAGSVVAGAQGATASGSAAAQVVAPITLTREADLDFGTIAVAPLGAGSVTVAPLGGAAVYAGSAGAICGSTCAPPHPARFAVTGEGGRSYRVTVPASLAIAAPDGAAGITVDSLVVSSTSQPGSAAGVLTEGGSDTFAVGGTLRLPSQAPPGRYTAQVPVIVSYP